MIPRPMAPGYHDTFIAYCRECGFAPNIAQRAKQMQTVISLVSNGFGIALVPESLTNLQRPGVRYLALAESSPSIGIGLVHRRRDANPVLRSFAEVVRETVLATGRAHAPRQAGAQRLGTEVSSDAA